MYPSRFEVVIYPNDETGIATFIQSVITDPKCHQRVKSPNTTLERICYAPILPIKKEPSRPLSIPATSAPDLEIKLVSRAPPGISVDEE